MECPFCQLGDREVVAQNESAIAVRDHFPVSEGHTLIIPRQHVGNWFDASPGEQKGILDLLDEVRLGLESSHAPAGYNVGFNVGAAAGQTVMHLHVHVIPRYEGDVDDPTGGVRLVIPDRGNYRRPGYVPQSREATP